MRVNNAPVTVASTADGVTLTLPQRDEKSPDQVVVVVLAR